MQTNGKTDGMDRGMADKLANLKQRLLLEHLNATPGFETHAVIMLEANEAAALAWLSSYPLLTFPCLFEERAAAATEHSLREARLYWEGLGLNAQARAA
jgi:hypothetical protein